MAEVTRGERNPWTFIPLLYFMQAMPVTLVQDVSVIVFKDLGIQNEQITRWTSLIALPWGLQMLLGPFVDLSFTKRGWILGAQSAIAALLVVAAFVVGMPNAFGFSLVVLGLTALMSALCNIATDGFAILSMTKTQQAQMAGFMSTFYRLGRLFCASLLVFIAGVLMRKNGAAMEPGAAWTAVLVVAAVVYGILHVVGRFAVPRELPDTPPPDPLPAGEPNPLPSQGRGSDEVRGEGWVAPAGSLGESGTPPPTPLPATQDIRGEGERESSFENRKSKIENRQNLLRTVWLVLAGISGYFFLNACVRLFAHALWAFHNGELSAGDTTVTLLSVEGPLGKWDPSGWKLPDNNRVPFLDWPVVGSTVSPVTVELVQLAVCAALCLLAFTQARRTIRNSEFGESLGSFVSQPGFAGILFFIVFYRFPEAMVGKISALFLKDAVDKGGLALSNEQLGILSGLIGVVGIILGGIVGGLVVSKIGIRKAFVPLALAMHVPNILYLLVAYHKLPMVEAGGLNWTIGSILFVDQFGYGFGFAGYMVYLMWVAQRGRFTTSHYAIGTGMGALCIAVAGVVSGVLQANYGYVGVFWAVMFASIPGLIAILIAPLDDSHREIKVSVD